MKHEFFRGNIDTCHIRMSKIVNDAIESMSIHIQKVQSEEVELDITYDWCIILKDIYYTEALKSESYKQQGEMRQKCDYYVELFTNWTDVKEVKKIRLNIYDCLHISRFCEESVKKERYNNDGHISSYISMITYVMMNEYFWMAWNIGGGEQGIK